MTSWRGFLTIGIVIVFTSACALAGETDKLGLPVVSQSISVADAVTIALSNNPSVASRRFAVDAAAARVGMVRAMTRPQVSTSSFATQSSMGMIVPGPENVGPQNFTLTPDKARLDQNLMAMYPLYTGGGLKSRVGSARELRNAAQSDTSASELDTALAVKSAYYQVLYQRQVALAYQKRVDEGTERLRIAQESFDAGKIAKFDVLRSQTDLAEAQQMLNNAQRDESVALVDLKSAMGISQVSQLTLSDNLGLPTTTPTLDDVQAKAYAGRPEVTAARARLRSAEAVLGAARSAYKPQVYATAMVDVSATKDGTDSGYLLGITAALPILDGGQRKSAVSEAQAMLDQMRADKKASVLMVSRDVASSYVQLDAAEKNVKLSEAAVTQSEEDYRVMRLRYEAGKSTNVEVLDALATLTRAQTNRAEALYNYNVARDTLVRATGQR